MTALLHFRRPDVSVDGSDVIIHSANEKSPISLSIHHIPVCISFGFYDNGERHLMDPCFEEEIVQDSSMTFVLNVHRELCAISKAGGILLTTEKILHCATIANFKAAELTAMIKDALK